MAGPDLAQLVEWRRFPQKFIHDLCHVKDEVKRKWVPFHLWDAQKAALDILANNNCSIGLKARQLGFTWLVTGYMMWNMIMKPGSTILIFSKRDNEAAEVLHMRLKGIYERLPDWIKPVGKSKMDGKHDWVMGNGSRAMAFPTTGGRSYTGSLVLIDEADWIPKLDDLLDATKPTVDAGGQLILLSSPDKEHPTSAFKNIYRAGKLEGTPEWNGFKPIFFGWDARPDRTTEWYEAQKRFYLSRDGTLDMLYQEYASTDVEALAPRALDKRISPEWLMSCYKEYPTIPSDSRPPMPAIPQLVIYKRPEPNHRYMIGMDLAEGNPNSDDSAFVVLDIRTGEEVAALTGKFQPEIIAAHADTVGRWYNVAEIMPERNNHGHAAILWLRDNGRLRLISGLDGKYGWVSSTKGKAVLYDFAASAFRNKETILHSFETFTQLASIEGSSLRAPSGLHDDRADAYALALAGIARRPNTQSIPFGFGGHSAVSPFAGDPNTTWGKNTQR